MDVDKTHRNRKTGGSCSACGFAGGHGGYPIIGSPEDDVAANSFNSSWIGFAGTTLTFVNFLAEFPYFADEVLPRLERAGLRQRRIATAA